MARDNERMYDDAFNTFLTEDRERPEWWKNLRPSRHGRQLWIEDLMFELIGRNGHEEHVVKDGQPHWFILGPLAGDEWLMAQDLTADERTFLMDKAGAIVIGNDVTFVGSITELNRAWEAITSHLTDPFEEEGDQWPLR